MMRSAGRSTPGPLAYHTAHIGPPTSGRAGALPARNRPATRAATFARHTEAIKRLKQKRMLPRSAPGLFSCSSGRSR
jgi:hypothetical protein